MSLSIGLKNQKYAKKTKNMLKYVGCMINTEKIERLIQLTITSGYVKDKEAPLSIILLGESESGKTKIINKFDNKHLLEISDLSQKPIVDMLISALVEDKIHHILIPDLVKVLSHNVPTTQATIAFLNALMDEGIKSQMFFNMQFKLKKRVKCGLITSCTFDYYYKVFRNWHDIGFLTRFLPVSFIYSEDTIIEINHQIAQDNYFFEKMKLNSIKKETITIPKDISEKIEFLVQQIITKQSNESIRITTQGGKQKMISFKRYGFRFHKQIRKLLQSIALINGRIVCTYEDLNELLSLIDYIRLPKNPKVL